MTAESFFCLLQIKVGHIYYMHDSTESTEDSFTLTASAYEIDRRSLPVTISVTVIPVNDEPPILTRNTGLEVMFYFNMHLLLLFWTFFQHILNSELEMLLLEKSVKCKLSFCWILHFNWWEFKLNTSTTLYVGGKNNLFSKQKCEHLKPNDESIEKNSLVSALC